MPTHERREPLRRLLQALATQTLPPEAYEVVVVIDGSRDGTEEMVRGLAMPYRLHAVWQPQRGRAGACNAGARSASAPLLLFLDDDMEPLPGLLEAHVAAHSPGGQRGIVGAAPIAFDSASPPLLAYRGRHFQRKLDRLAQRERLRFNDVYTGNFSIGRAAFLGVGGFDEAFRLYGHEDYELALRLERAGVALDYCAEATAMQHYTKDVAQLAHDVVQEGQTAVQFARKQPEALPYLELHRFLQRPRRWRWRLELAAALGRVHGQLPALIVQALRAAEAAWPNQVSRLYDSAFEYLYWLGVDQELNQKFSSNRHQTIRRKMALLRSS